jgi:hypothetical protein
MTGVLEHRRAKGALFPLFAPDSDSVKKLN